MRTARAARRALLAAAATALLAAGCATLDELAVAETHRLDDAPWILDLAGVPVPPGSCAVVLPATLDPALRDAVGYADRLPRLAPLLDAVNARSAARRDCVRAGGAVPAQGAPRLYLGVADGELAPPEAEAQRVPGDRFAPMVLHLDRPSAAWRDAARRAAAEAGAPYTVQIQLGISQYAKGRRGLVRKEVWLGSGHRRPIPFLTAEDRPVEVLHLTGVLFDADGRARRAGAEGILLRDTPFLAQVVDLAILLDDATLARALGGERRPELPGAPLSWEIALDNLLAQLTGGAVLVPARQSQP